MQQPVIELKGVTKTYRRGFWRTRVQGLTDVSFQVFGGEVFGLLGPNGAGKTTTFKILTGLLQPTQGTGTINGQPIGSSLAYKQVGYLPESPAVPDYLSGRQFLEFMGVLLGIPRAELRAQIPPLLEKVGLLEKADLIVRKYSKGMIQRLALAQALLGNPPVLILDEPMSGLDPVGRKLVRDIIASLKADGRTVIFSSHVLLDAEALCDRVGIIVGGRLRDVGAVNTLVSGNSVSVEIVVKASDFALPASLATLGVSVQNRGGQCVLFAPGDREADEVLRHLKTTETLIESVHRHRETLEDFFVRRTAEIDARGLQGAITNS